MEPWVTLPDGIILKHQIVAAVGPAAYIGAAGGDVGGSAVHGVGAVFDGDGLGGAIQNIALRHFGFGDYHGAAGNQASYNDSPILAGGVAPQHSAIAVLYRELGAGDGLARDGVQLGKRQAAQGFVQEGEGLGVHGVHGDRLGLGTLVDDVARSGLDLLDHHSAGDAADADLTLVIGGVETVAAQMAVVIVNVSAVGVGELELRTGNESAGHTVFLLNDQGSGPLVPEGKFGGLGACGDLHTLRGPIQHKALRGLNFPCGEHGSGFQPLDHDLACGVGVEGAIAGADRRTAAVYNLKDHTSQRLVGGPLNVLVDREIHSGIILEGQIIAIAGIGAAAGIASCGPAAVHGVGAIFHDDGLGRSIQDIAIRHLGFRHDHCAAGNEAGDCHRAVLAGGIAAQKIAIAVLHREHRTRNRFPGNGVQLGQRQAAQGFVQEGEGLGVQGIHRDRLGLGTLVDDVAGSCLDLLGHHGAGDAADADLTLVIGGVETVAAQMPVVIVHVPAVGIRQLELRTGNESAGHTVFLLNDKRTGPLVPKRELLHFTALDENVLGRPIQHEALDRLDLPHLHGGAGFDALQHDLSGLVRVVHAIVRADSSAIAVHDLKGHAGQRLVLGPLDKLADNQRGAGFIVKDQAVGHAGAYHDALGRLIEDVALGGLFLGDDHGGIGGQPGNGDRTVSAGGVDPVVGADHMAIAVPHHKLSALQGLLGHSVPLQDRQGAEGIVIKPDGLSIPGVDHHGLGGGVLAVIVRFPFLRHYISAGEQLGENDLTVDIGGVEAVGGGHALVVRGQLSVGGHHLKLCAGERLLGDAVVLLDDQAALAGVLDHHGLGVAALPNDHVGGGRVNDIPAVRGLDLIDHISAGGQICDLDLALGIGGEDAVLGQSGRADDTVQAHLAASGCRDPELGSGQHLVGLTVPFLDDQAAFRLVFEGEGDRFARLDLDGLALGVQNETRRGADLGDHHALSGLQAGNADLAVLVCSENTVGIANQGPVRIRDFELGVLQGHAGIGGADLTDEQDAVRGVVEGDGDHVLLTLVGNVDGLGGVDDGVAICGADFLNNIGPLGQPGPDAGPVLPCGFLPNHGTSSAGRAAQKAELEGAARKCLMGHTVVFLDHDGV